MMYTRSIYVEIDPILLSLIAMIHVSFPLLSLGLSTVNRTHHEAPFPMARKIDLVGLTKPKIQRRNMRL